MSRSSNSNIIKHLRGAGIPDDWHEGEIAIDTQNNILACCVSSDGTGKAIGLITSSAEPSDAAYRNTLWLDTNSTSTGIPANYQVANNLTTASSGSYVLDAYQGKLLNDAITAQNTAISALSVDYVVEQGTNGIWTYRKWNSGIAECWGTTTATVSWTTWGNLYSSTASIGGQTFPFTFTSVLFHKATLDDYNAWVLVQNASTTAFGQIWAISAAQPTISGKTLELYAMGKWK